MDRMDAERNLNAKTFIGLRRLLVQMTGEQWSTEDKSLLVAETSASGEMQNAAHQAELVKK